MQNAARDRPAETTRQIANTQRPPIHLSGAGAGMNHAARRLMAAGNARAVILADRLYCRQPHHPFSETRASSNAAAIMCPRSTDIR